MNKEVNYETLELYIFSIYLVFASNSGEKRQHRIVSVSGIFNRQVEEFTVSEVQPDSAAQQAGLKKGDVVTAIENCAIPGCPSGDAKKLMAKQAGEILNLTITRGEETNLPIVIHVR